MGDNIYADLLALIEILNQLSDDERLEIFSKYCLHCGIRLDLTQSGKCFCWRDE